MRVLRWSLLGGVMALAGCGLGGPAYEPPGRDVAAVVEMTTTLGFYPSVVTIHSGETIAWHNRSWFHHTVTFDPARAETPADVSLPPGAVPFTSGRVDPGQVYRHGFTTPGTYRYICRPHEGMAMAGTVVVLP